MLKVSLDTAKKVLFVKVSGALTLSEIEVYVKEFEDTLGKIDPKQYVLLMDVKEQKTVPQEGVPYLEKCMKLYAETPFRKRFYVALESAIAMLQSKKAGKGSIETFIMVTSVEEAYAQV